MSAALIWFEDFQPGRVYELGTHSLSAGDIAGFAAHWVPLPRAAIAAGPVAGGWLVACRTMRAICDTFMLDAASLGAPGIDTLVWTAPVQAGDALAMRTHVLATRVSASRPELGLVAFRHLVDNQRGERVMEMENSAMFARRAAAEAAP